MPELGAQQNEPFMAKKAKKVPFDPKVFLASVNSGRRITSYRKDEAIFAQGGPWASEFLRALRARARPMLAPSDRCISAPATSTTPKEFSAAKGLGEALCER